MATTSGPHDTQAMEALLVAHLGTVDRMAASICRRYGMSGDDADDFASWVKLKLVDNDYAVLRKFRGESQLSTYLAVVVASLFRGYHVASAGRWRPSAAARALGPVAVRLEKMVFHEGIPRQQAFEMLRSSGATADTDAELVRLLGRLPARTRPRLVPAGSDPLETVEGSGSADERVREAEEAREQANVQEALKRELDRLPREDRLILNARFWQGLSVADTARLLKLEQKPLYRRLDRLLAALRKDLEAAGISGDQIRDLLSPPEAP
jgi:RNA polymerase sigma factor (sigma-70 family)